MVASRRPYNEKIPYDRLVSHVNQSRGKEEARGLALLMRKEDGKTEAELEDDQAIMKIQLYV